MTKKEESTITVETNDEPKPCSCESEDSGGEVRQEYPFPTKCTITMDAGGVTCQNYEFNNPVSWRSERLSDLVFQLTVQMNPNCTNVINAGDTGPAEANDDG